MVSESTDGKCSIGIALYRSWFEMGIQIVALPREEDEQRSPSSGPGADPGE